MDLPAPTIVTMPNHASTSLCHPEEVRALSLRECAAIQGFLPDWGFEGTLQERYAQVGNAVPVVLGEVAATLLAGHLDGTIRSEPSDLFAEDSRFRIVYLKSHIRTRKWYSGGEAHIWNADDTDRFASTVAVTHRRERPIGPSLTKRAG